MKCKISNCDKKAKFNLLNQNVGLYCYTHKQNNMIDITRKLCIEKNCSKRPSFNLENEKLAIYCNEHKKNNMINVIDKRCLKENCNIICPVFNYPNEKSGIYCNEHKKEEMVNLKKYKNCIENDCCKRPSFNLENEEFGLYCFSHKKENMIDVVSNICLEQNCRVKPVFNLPTETIGIYCVTHKKENMIDIKSKKCSEENCNKQPQYNFSNEKIGIYCVTHKKENMIDVKKQRCLHKDCNKISIFNFSTEKIGIYCNEHKKKDMTDIKNKKCKNNCGVNITNKYKGYCLRCFINLFPNEKISRNYKVKENYMTDFLKEEFKDEIMVFDKTIGGCSKRRPDVYIDKFTHVLIIECDENQHSSKEYTNCDTKRTMEIFQDFGNIPLVYIRFNPDSYINEENKKILSSFKNHKTLFVPMIRLKKELDNRLHVLKETIVKWLIKIPEREITYEYLFYDTKPE